MINYSVNKILTVIVVYLSIQLYSHAEIIISTIKRKAGSSAEVELVYVNDFKESKKKP